jgi:hypothetical protein
VPLQRFSRASARTAIQHIDDSVVATPAGVPLYAQEPPMFGATPAGA